MSPKYFQIAGEWVSILNDLNISIISIEIVLIFMS